MTQEQAVYNYLLQHGEISSKVARDELRIIQLPCRISRLKDSGISIKTEMRTVETIYGKTRVAYYSLGGAA